MSSLAGALASPQRSQLSSPARSAASPKAEDAEMDNLDDLQPPFASQDAIPVDDKKEDDEQELNDLFGEDEDVNMVEHDRPASSVASEHADHDDGLSSPERRHREQLEYAEEEEPEQVMEQRLEADVAIPNIPVPRSSDGSYWVIRMPNFIKVDSKPFHPDTYVGPDEDEEGQQSESLREKSMSVKLKVENTVRWRWGRDQHGQDRRQSNSRIVRWSDGSLSLQLGKELFDITQSIDTSGAVPRQALGGSQPPALSQSQSQSQSQPGGTHAQGLTYLVAQHKRAEILQCEAVITGYMSLRPTGMQSETHRMLVRAVGQKHTRVARLRMAPEPTTDPERERLELEKAAARKPRKSRGGYGGEDDGLGPARRRRSSYARKRTSDDMWSDDDDDDVGFVRGGSEDEYGVDDRKGKRRKSGEENARKGPGEYLTDDFLVADTDEDEDFAEEDTGRRKRKRSARTEEDEAEEDDLERLEAKISQNEAAERKRRQKEEAPGGGEGGIERSVGASAADEDAMDVESEEEEDDDFALRRSRASSGPRKRRAIGLDEEEEEE
ncbi:Leo1-like protein-domain-containing protein [Cubamyces lactineus]|nr:Leo1-like protein-domain-containing protein [Cubamyces lactineus]